MKRLITSLFSRSGYGSGKKLFFHSAVVLLLFFRLCRLYQAGFWVCVLAFILGQLFLVFAEFVYCLLSFWLGLLLEVFSLHETDKNVL